MAALSISGNETILQEIFNESPINVDTSENTDPTLIPPDSATKKSRKSATAKSKIKNSPNLKENITPKDLKKENPTELENKKSPKPRKRASTRQPLKVLNDSKEIPKVSQEDLSEKESPFPPGVEAIKKENSTSTNIIIYEDLPEVSLTKPKSVNFQKENRGFLEAPGRSKPKDIPGGGRRSLMENSRKSVNFVLPPKNRRSRFLLNDIPNINGRKSKIGGLSVKDGNLEKTSPSGSKAKVKLDPKEIENAVLTLEVIFPNVDPEYLKHQYIKQKGSLQDTVQVVMSIEKAEELPSRENYLKRLETETLQNQYWEKFSIENYLKIIPDPWSYFLIIERHNCARYAGHSFHYLKNHFKKHYIQVIEDTFVRNEYSLYLTYKELQKKNRFLKMRAANRSKLECDAGKPITFDIQFMHEVAFIENESRIRACIKRTEVAKIKKLKQAQKAGTLLECQCCLNPELLVEEAITCPANHVFCADCITKYVDIDPNLDGFQFKCLLKCQEIFSLDYLKECISPGIMAKVIERIPPKESKVNQMEYLVCCPFCYHTDIIPESVTVFACPNPNCMMESCRYCKQLNHLPEKCGDSTSFNADSTVIEEQLLDQISISKQEEAPSPKIDEFAFFDLNETIIVDDPDLICFQKEENNTNRMGTTISSVSQQPLPDDPNPEIADLLGNASFSSEDGEFVEAAEGGPNLGRRETSGGNADSPRPSEPLWDFVATDSQTF